MGRLTAPLDYESLRKARILENQEKLASLGLQKTIFDLRSAISSAKSVKTPVRKCQKKIYAVISLRRSDRLKGNIVESAPRGASLRRSSRLAAASLTSQKEAKAGVNEGSFAGASEEKRPANAPLVKIHGREHQLSPEASARRCHGKGRGSVYDPVFGICCHFCRQKTLCGEEDCKRCGDLDENQPCTGKTDCSVCHSSNGVLCRACLKVRYGEELEEVRENKEWMCPHCIEEKGTKPYWICNSSICLKKRKMVPTGLAIYRAREMGYKSVAHLLMDDLQKANKQRR